MTIPLGPKSLSKLTGVSPDLVRVVKRAALLATPEQDFTVLQGLRTREECCVNYGKGRTALDQSRRACQRAMPSHTNSR